MIPKSIQNLIDELNKLPGIGPKSAERLVFYLLNRSDEEIKRLGEAVLALKKGISLCPSCYQFSHNGTCTICADQSRDHTQICVVEKIADLMAIERTGAYQGVYHVLHGRIDPLHRIGPEHIKLKELHDRVLSDTTIKEIIIATDPDIEGETTAMYIARMFEKKNIKITRIARGLPSGGNVEFADDTTLRNALKGRTDY
jgi:recombination protein RecR